MITFGFYLTEQLKVSTRRGGERERAYSKEGGIERRANAARTQPVYMWRSLYQLSYRDAPQTSYLINDINKTSDASWLTKASVVWNLLLTINHKYKSRITSRKCKYEKTTVSGGLGFDLVFLLQSKKVKCQLHSSAIKSIRCLCVVWQCWAEQSARVALAVCTPKLNKI